MGNNVILFIAEWYSGQSGTQSTKIKGIANNHSFTANLRIVLTFTGLCFVLRKESSTLNRPFSVVQDWIGASKLSLPFPTGCAAV